MKSITQEWVEKAEGDFATAQRELRARKSPNYDSACFHAQQCVEKYLKARLQEENVRFSKTHDLLVLLDLLLAVEPGWDSLRSDLQALTSFAVDFRYPGMTADRAIAKEALKICRTVREVVSVSLGFIV
jgi:HEPN domain-containing protein